MSGGFLGAIGQVANIATLGLTDMLGITGGGVKAPDAPPPTEMTNQMGNVIGSGSGKTLDITEQDKQRGSVSKKRLGAKQLQIPLASASAAGVNTSPSTGVKV